MYQKHSPLGAIYHMGFDTDNKTWFIKQKFPFVQSEEDMGQENVTSMNEHEHDRSQT